MIINTTSAHKKCIDSSSAKAKTLALLYILFLAATITNAQQKIIGTITGTSDVPLTGATVHVKNTGKASTTDAKGFFSIAVVKGDVLVVSFIGYVTREMTIANETSLKISLSETVVNLDEVVVTGYATQKVKEITGSVAIVKPKDLTAIPAGQVVPMLQGRVAGLYVTSSGQPGGGSNIRLHGIGNFGNVTPLFIIDGVQGNLDNLNPDDIESLQVLKDAGSYSIYGVRGANGVIVITTKKSKTMKPTISYNFYIGKQFPSDKGFSYLNTKEEADLKWLQYKNSGMVDATGNPFDELYGNGPIPVIPDYIQAGRYGGFFEGDPEVDPGFYNLDYRNGRIYQIVKADTIGTDWFHQIFKPALNQNHTLTVSGGGDKSRYLFSFGYLNQQGTLLNTYLKRYTVRLNTEFNVKNNIRIGENVQMAYKNNPKISNNERYFNPVKSASNPAILPLYDIMGNWATTGLNYPGALTNPLGERVLSKDNIDNTWEIFGNAYAEVDFLKYLTARTNFGGSITNYSFTNYDYGSYDQLNGTSNTLVESAGYRTSWTWTNTLSFARTFANSHQLKIFAATEAISNYSREFSVNRSGFFSNAPDYRQINNGVTGIGSFGFARQSALFSLISRVDYGFNDKYFIAATLRKDGSSVFAQQSRFGWFPSVAGAWRISRENIMKDLNWITEWKLRASWGITGFDGNTDPNNQFSLFGSSPGRSYYDINGASTRPEPGFYTLINGNPQTSWQQDVVINAGVDAILWNGKLSFSADLYSKKATGLLLNKAMPYIYGDAMAPNVNIGNIKNTGVDLLLGSKGTFAKDFRWDVTLTFTTYKNEIIHLNDINYFSESPASYLGTSLTRSEVGHPAGLFYGYKVIGIFQDLEEVSKYPPQNGAAPGKFKYLDANGDNKIDDADRIFIGSPHPKFTLGMNIALYYRNFDFSTFLYGSFGNEVANTMNPHGGNKAFLYQSWTPGRTNTDIPISVFNPPGDFSTLGAFNSFFVENGSYIKNKSVMLGYSFPAAFLQRFNISKLRFYFQALNVFTITQYSGLDPEVTGANTTGNYTIQTTPKADFGIDIGNYPNNQKQYVVGLNVDF